MSIDEVRQRIEELSADVDRAAVAQSPVQAMASQLHPAYGPGAQLLAQARVELAVYTGATESVFALFRSAIDRHDTVLADVAAKTMQDMEPALGLAKATVEELERAAE
jgi:hypothetical protein